MRAGLDWLTARPIAHRGLHDKGKGLIENTVGAALAAIASRYAIECDIQLTADEEAVVFHDPTLERLTEASGAVDGLSAGALGAIVIRRTRDRIPRLSDWLGKVAGQTPVVIEIKSRFDGDQRLTRRAVEVARSYTRSCDGKLAFKSFDPTVLTTLREIAPEIPRGIVAMGRPGYEYDDFRSLSAGEKHALANLLHFSQTKPDFLSWHVVDLPSAAPFLCRSELGLPLMTWTVRTEDERKTAAANADQMVFEGFRP